MTDITKYKSVAIKIDTYKRAKPMADKLYMSIGAYLRYLIDKDFNDNEQKIDFETTENLANGEDQHVGTK